MALYNHYIIYTLMSILLKIQLIYMNMNKLRDIFSTFSGNLIIFLYTYFMTGNFYFSSFFNISCIIFNLLGY